MMRSATVSRPPEPPVAVPSRLAGCDLSNRSGHKRLGRAAMARQECEKEAHCRWARLVWNR